MIEYYLGIPSDYIIIGLAGVALLELILIIVALVLVSRQKKRYDFFMRGKNGKSLEDMLVRKFNEIDDLAESNASNERKIEILQRKMKFAFSRYGIVKYDALDELGGKMSYVQAMLDESENGYVINVVHAREGCYNYIKEIIDGNSITTLSPEEQEALDKAKASNNA